MVDVSRDVFLERSEGIDFAVRAASFDESEDDIRNKSLQSFRSWIEMVVEAKRFFGLTMKRVVFALGEAERNVLGSAVKDGFILWVNLHNKILDYNCVVHAVIYHEYAHWIDLTRRRKTDRLEERSLEEIQRQENDPVWYGEWLFDEYRANQMVPEEDLRSLKLVAAANLLGSEADGFFERIENKSNPLVAVHALHGFGKIVDFYLPVFLCEPREQQQSFRRVLQESSEGWYKKWQSVCFNVERMKPVYRQVFPVDELPVLIIGSQNPHKEAYPFNTGIFPLPAKFKDRSDYAPVDYVLNLLKKPGGHS